jgi:hypothetical protein
VSGAVYIRNLTVLAGFVIGVTAYKHGMGACPENVALSPDTSSKCPTGQYLARVCASEPDGPSWLCRITPVGGHEP